MRAAYKRYQGNTGRVELREDAEPRAVPFTKPPPPPEPNETPPGPEKPPPPPGPNGPPPPSGSKPGGLTGLLEGLLSRLDPAKLETEDLILAGIFYLLYRETGDAEFLYLAGGILFL